MMMEEFKAEILHQLEKAVDRAEVEEIINNSINQFQDENLYTFLIIIYLHILKNDLEKLSKTDFDSVQWRVIRYAVMYLEKINNNLKNK